MPIMNKKTFQILCFRLDHLSSSCPQKNLKATAITILHLSAKNS